MERRSPSAPSRFFRAALLLFALPLIITAYALYGHLADWVLLLRLFPRRRRRIATRLAAHWGTTILRLFTTLGGVVIARRGALPAPGGAPLLIVANHQSLIDILLVLALFQDHHPRFVLKRELAWGVPNVSPATRAAGFAFVDRRPEARAKNLASLARFAAWLVEDNAAGVIFPEGTWEPEGAPLPFKRRGLEALLRAAPLDVLPIVIDGSHRAPRFRDVLRRLGDLPITVVIGPRIPASEAADVDALLPRLEAHLATTLTALRREPRS